MAESTRPGWWRTGNVSARLVCLGAALGAAGAVVHFLSHAWGHEIRAYALAWGLFFLVLEGIFMAIRGLLVAGAVLSARFLVTDTVTREPAPSSPGSWRSSARECWPMPSSAFFRCRPFRRSSARSPDSW